MVRVRLVCSVPTSARMRLRSEKVLCSAGSLAVAASISWLRPAMSSLSWPLVSLAAASSSRSLLAVPSCSSSVASSSPRFFSSCFFWFLNLRISSSALVRVRGQGSEVRVRS